MQLGMIGLGRWRLSAEWRKCRGGGVVASWLLTSRPLRCYQLLSAMRYQFGGRLEKSAHEVTT